MGLIDILQTNRKLLLVLCSLVAALALAAPATAQDSFQISSVTQDQYGDPADQFAGGGSTPTSSVGSLPFTGLDVALMAGAAVTLLGAGLVIRRRTSADESS